MQELLQRLLETPALQGALVATSAMVSEDAAAVASGALVAGQQMHFTTAFLGLAIGIAFGDLFLFTVGRLAGSRYGRADLTASPRVAKAASVFRRFGPWVILGARCVPGTRLPTYVAAGLVRTRWSTFLLTAVPAAAIWSFLLVLGLSRLGGALLDHVRTVQWFLLAAVAFAVVAYFVVRWRRRRPAPA